MRFGICTTSWMLPKTLRMRFFAPELRCAGWAALVAMLYLPCSKFFPPLSGIAADSQDQFTRKKVRVRDVGSALFASGKTPYTPNSSQSPAQNGPCPEGERADSIIGMMDAARKTRAPYLGY